MTPQTPDPRPIRRVGRMGIQRTVKLPGDKIWNSRLQRWEVVQ